MKYEILYYRPKGTGKQTAVSVFYRRETHLRIYRHQMKRDAFNIHRDNTGISKEEGGKNSVCEVICEWNESEVHMVRNT